MESSTGRRSGFKIAIGGLWVVTVLDAALMGLAGAAKFLDPAGWMAMFQGWGYPAWFAVVIGAGEVGLALLLLVPRLASYAAAGLIMIMVGALATVLLHPGGRMGPGPPLVHLVALGIILWARWRVRWQPGSRSSGSAQRPHGPKPRP